MRVRRYAHSARPRTEQRTIEYRCCCQQPWADHMVVPALGLGISEAAKRIVHDPQLDHLKDWSTMRRMHEAVIAKGLAVEVRGRSN